MGGSCKMVLYQNYSENHESARNVRIQENVGSSMKDMLLHDLCTLHFFKLYFKCLQ